MFDRKVSPIHHSRFILCWGWFALAMPLVPCLLGRPVAAEDWAYWRGPNFNGTVSATDLPEDWNPKGGEGSNLIWKRDDIGGPSTPIAMGGRLYTIQRSEPGTPREGEKVVCLDAKTGQTLWENAFNVWLSDVPAERIGWSSVVGDPETDTLFALGSCDLFQCIDADSGKTLWSVPLHEQFGMLSTYGGRTNFPVVHEDLVIISGIIINWGDAAKPNHRLLAMDKRTGEVIWFSGTKDLPYDTTYSAPSLVTIDGQRQLVMGAGDGAIWGFQPRTGKPLWRYPLSRRGIFATPLVDGNRVFASHSEENIGNNSMGAVVGLRVTGTGDETRVEEMWKIEELVAGYSEPVLFENRLYLVDDRCKMWVIDADTGERIVERKGFLSSRQRAALTLADGKIYVLSENGPWGIVRPTEDGFELINKGRIRGMQFAGSPIVAGGNLIFPGSSTLFCVGTGRGNQASVDPERALGIETPVAEDSEIATLLVTPAEVLLRPGQRQKYAVRAFNALGQRLPTPGDVQFTVDAAGTFDRDTLVVADSAAHTGAVVTASVGDVSGSTRFRVVPDLPWKFTFDDLKSPPLAWIGARYRHVIKPVDGSPALVKISTIPKGARSRAWMGSSELAEYTIAADVRGQRNQDQLPDIGLTNHGYVLDLMGQSQQLQIRTWSAQLRMAVTVEFPWQEDTWYRMKFRSDLRGDGDDRSILLRGKVWEIGSEEPADWTITATDAAPNLRASPGLYGNAKVAELYLDNVEVTANTP